MKWAVAGHFPRNAILLAAFLSLSRSLVETKYKRRHDERKKVNRIDMYNLQYIMMLLDSWGTLFVLQLFSCIEHDFMGNAHCYCGMPNCGPCTPIHLTATPGGRKAILGLPYFI